MTAGYIIKQRIDEAAPVVTNAPTTRAVSVCSVVGLAAMVLLFPMEYLLDDSVSCDSLFRRGDASSSLIVRLNLNAPILVEITDYRRCWSSAAPARVCIGPHGSWLKCTTCGNNPKENGGGDGPYFKSFV